MLSGACGRVRGVASACQVAAVVVGVVGVVAPVLAVLLLWRPWGLRSCAMWLWRPRLDSLLMFAVVVGLRGGLVLAVVAASGRPPRRIAVQLAVLLCEPVYLCARVCVCPRVHGPIDVCVCSFYIQFLPYLFRRFVSPIVFVFKLVR